ncbi:MAG: DedA family protein [Methylobacter sp.]|uniref:DedA family protein n=1 Tax=Candidatus Methylobacter titanis TaxID=3053457 RepID=A0AA43TL18_9GAMM|nr:DedA family protein [Candidatus Methylobacter titanis]
MEELTHLIQTNIPYAPYIIFGALMLAGLNIPISEDAMLFVSAVLASTYPDYLVQFFIAVYLGAYLSDLVCYWLGRILGAKLFEIRFFANRVSAQRIGKIHLFYEKHGLITILVGRFIPFGVRNGLFLTAGLGRMNFLKFALADLTACTITTISYFSLYYHYGNSVIDYIKTGNKIVFAVAVTLTAIIYYLFKKPRRA